VPLLTWRSTIDARVHYAVLKIRAAPDTPTRRIHGVDDSGPTEAERKTPVPSGPNNVPGRADLTVPFQLPEEMY
jgi:hypothetical protein